MQVVPGQQDDDVDAILLPQDFDVEPLPDIDNILLPQLPDDDSIDEFFQIMAQTVKSFSKEKRLQVKESVASVVWEAEAEELNAMDIDLGQDLDLYLPPM